MIQAPSNETTQHKRTRSSDLTWRDMACLTERCHMGANDKRVARTCTSWHPGGHNVEKLIQVPSNETCRPECANGQSQLSKTDMGTLE